MKLINKKSAVITTILMVSLLSACGGGSADKIISDIIDDIDVSEKRNQASISYINALEQSTTFYTQSTVYPNSVYENKHKVVALMANNVSNELTHKWLDNAKETKFAYEDGNSANNRKELIENLQNNKRYWSIAWQQDGVRNLSVLEKKPLNQANKLSFRIFTNVELNISINQQTAIYSTEVGQVSTAFTIEGCSDLMLGEFAIDLCQSGDYGNSYLVVFDSESSIAIIAQE
ncbi:MAG: hypothetical protein ACJAVV_002219 [Alphaproteobacteria bacterium]|jgi:hypothetical protein